MGQCAPNPSISGQAVSCSGTTANVYVITTDNSPLTVAAGATVATSTGQGIVVSMAATGIYSTRYAAITVDGSVAASNGSGILVLSGPPPPAFTTSTAPAASRFPETTRHTSMSPSPMKRRRP